MIDKTNFAILWSSALQSKDKNSFVAECATNSILGDTSAATKYLSNIWTVAHMTVRVMRETTGLSQIKFADLICAPRKTVINWEARGGITDYQRLWLASYLGLLP